MWVAARRKGQDTDESDGRGRDTINSVDQHEVACLSKRRRSRVRDLFLQKGKIEKGFL